MRWLNRLERKFGRFGIPNLTMIITLLMGTVFMLDFFFSNENPEFSLISHLMFVPSLIAQGEVWRLISYIIIPPETSLIFLLFALYLFYLIGNSLDQHWGSFKLTVYYLIGMIGTTAGAFITGGATNTYLNLSLFLAFAAIFPDFELMIFFVLPVKVKYLAYIDVIFYVFSLIFLPLTFKIACITSIINFLIFFGPDFIKRYRNKQSYRSMRRNFRKQMRENQKYR